MRFQDRAELTNFGRSGFLVAVREASFEDVTGFSSQAGHRRQLFSLIIPDLAKHGACG